MHFDLTPDQIQLKDMARRLFQQSAATATARDALEGRVAYDEPLWRQLAGLGWLGSAIPESFGGSGGGELELCVLAEEAGRALAALPRLSTVFLAADLIGRAGSDEARRRYLPAIAEGSLIVAVAERTAKPAGHRLPVWAGDALSGSVEPVLDGGFAGVVIVEAADAAAGGRSRLVIVDTAAPCVRVEDLATIDPSRPQVRISFDNAPGLALGAPGEAEALLQHAVDRAAALTAFEQIGGAERALDMARDYALQRHAFGRPIGSFQAIKHKLVDMYVAVTLARANALYAAWALESGSDQLAQAACVARVSAMEAFELCARENIQIHGGMGFVWDSECHMLYRRSSLLALVLRGGRYWRSRLVDEVRASGTLFEPVGAH